MSDLYLRPVKTTDASRLGSIVFEAFKHISEAHNFPPDFPSAQAGIGLAEMMIARPDIYGVTAEVGGEIVGSNFLWESDEVAGVGPITVDPAAQNSSIGKTLMQDVIRRAAENNTGSVRLVQAAFHNRSLALYTKLGFNTVEPLSLMAGPAINIQMPEFAVRQMTAKDVDAANAVCKAVHGISRRNEIAGSGEQGTGLVVQHKGRVTGYTTGIGFFGHTVGISNEELKALIGAGRDYSGSGFLLPTRNNELARWCMENGLRIVQPMTLMAKGTYQEPRGAFLPSILY